MQYLAWVVSVPCLMHHTFLCCNHFIQYQCDFVSVALQEERELEEEVEAARRAVLEQAAQRRREEGELDDEDLLIGAPRPGACGLVVSGTGIAIRRAAITTFRVAADTQATGVASPVPSICDVVVVFLSVKLNASASGCRRHLASWSRITCTVLPAQESR